jgi:hypothetical protein
MKGIDLKLKLNKIFGIKYGLDLINDHVEYKCINKEKIPVGNISSNRFETKMLN